MKNEEDRDRNLEFETDDEENQAQSHYSSSSSSSSSRSLSYYNNEGGVSYNVVGAGGGGAAITPGSYQPCWPQSYRQSIDMMSSVVVASPSVSNFLSTSKSNLLEAGTSFLRGLPFNASVSSTSAANFDHHHHHHPSNRPPHLTKPLIPSVPYRQQSTKRDSVVSWVPPSHSGCYPQSAIPSFAKSLPPSTDQCSSAQSIINGMNVMCGVGLLTTPYALKQGWWLSLSLLILFGIVSCYTGILLKRCLDSSPGLQTYPDIGQAAFGTSGRIFISVY